MKNKTVKYIICIIVIALLALFVTTKSSIAALWDIDLRSDEGNYPSNTNRVDTLFNNISIDQKVIIGVGGDAQGALASSGGAKGYLQSDPFIFCLNRGQRFDGVTTLIVKGKYETSNKELASMIRYYSGQETTLSDVEKENLCAKLEYIFAQIDSSSLPVRTQDSKVQVALWYLTNGNNWSSISGHATGEYLTGGAQLTADATAYSDYKNKINNENYSNTPLLKQEGNSIVVYYTKGTSQIELDSTIYKGEFGNIAEVNIRNANTGEELAVNKIEANQGYSVDGKKYTHKATYEINGIGKVTITVRFNDGLRQAKVILLENTKPYYSDQNLAIAKGTKDDNTQKIETFTFIPEISIEIEKFQKYYDSGYIDTSMSGVEFTIIAKQNGEEIKRETKVTNTEGKLQIKGIKPQNINNDVIVTIKETKVSGFSNLPTLNLAFRYNEQEEKWYINSVKEANLELSGNSGVYHLSNNSEISISYNEISNSEGIYNNFKLKVINQPQIEELVLLKTDSQTEEGLKGVKFNISLGNVVSINGYSSVAKDENGNLYLQAVSTNEEGKIVLKGIVLYDASRPITVEIEETEALLGYKRLDGKVTFEIRRYRSSNNTFGWKIENLQYNQERNEKETISILEDSVAEGGSIQINITNIPIMNLGGIVWEDTQHGIKSVELADGKFDGDEGLENIEVKLYKQNGNNLELIEKDTYGKELITKTANEGNKLTYDLKNGETDAVNMQKGQYVFPNIEKGTYIIAFGYDGIQYKTVKVSENSYTYNRESKVDEDSNERIAFNNKFNTIKDSTNEDSEVNSYATAVNKDNTTLELKYEKSEVINGIATSKLVTKDANGDVLPDYKMIARTIKTYLQTETEWKNTWNENGKINFDHYAQDINCGLIYRYFDLSINMLVDTAKLTINGKETTYTYEDINNKIMEETNLEERDQTKYELYYYFSDYNYRISDYITSEDGAINNKMYSEDANNVASIKNNIEDELRAFVTYKVIIENQSTIGSAYVNELAYYYDTHYKLVSATRADGTKISFTDDSSLPRVEGKTSARVSDFAQSLGSNDYRQELYFTFEVEKSKDGTRTLPKDIECANKVEILSYSSGLDEAGNSQGLVDNDSCPGNASVLYEDDTCKANGIKLDVKTNYRKIEGVVWEDLNKNGVKDEEETTLVNDAIVQLIEIVKATDGNNYEYIWQETKTANNEEYEFTEFIPGNYIVRFIYGDGSTYDLTDNIAKYNGQDYKSTIDAYYKEEYYNTVMEEYTKNSSVARDNEARRLEVIEYSTVIDKEKGEKLAQKDIEMLNNTWMCAETSKLNVPVDAGFKNNTNLLITIENSTTVEFNLQENKVEFNNTNFGLAKRPQTKLVLEKHITALKITPDGVGVQAVVDAKLDNLKDVIENGASMNISGVTQGLSQIKSTREERGYWKLETDIEELMQGADMEVEYTYVIRNESEEDYLSKDLIEEFEKGLTEGNYNTYLTTVAKTIKKDSKGNTNIYDSALGEFYYTGAKGENDKAVLSRLEVLEEAINGDLKYDEKVAGKYFKKREDMPVAEYRSYYDTDGNYIVANTENRTGKMIETIVQNINPSNVLAKGENDYTKTIKLIKELSAFNNGTTEGNYPSYIAEILKYTNAAGRRNEEATPGNLNYVHSENSEITLDSYEYTDTDGYTKFANTVPEGAKDVIKLNEEDEFWAESVIITKPTGENKTAVVQITIIIVTLTAVAIAGIILIKKYVLAK